MPLHSTHTAAPLNLSSTGQSNLPSASVLPAQAWCPAPPRFMIHDHGRRRRASASWSPGECCQRVKSKAGRRRERPTLRSRGCCLAVLYNGAPHSALANRTPQKFPARQIAAVASSEARRAPMKIGEIPDPTELADRHSRPNLVASGAHPEEQARTFQLAVHVLYTCISGLIQKREYSRLSQVTAKSPGQVH